MEAKLCPMTFGVEASENKDHFKCAESKCAWWVIPYSTEGVSCGGMCAVEMIAMKNSNGQYRV